MDPFRLLASGSPSPAALGREIKGRSPLVGCGLSASGMKMRDTIARIALCVGIFCLLFLGAVSPRADTGAGPAPRQAAPSASKGDTAKPAERSILISAPKVFQKMERPPVRFNHDKHTTALAPEGCDRCHPKDSKGAFLFTFPKAKDEKSSQALMNSFHDECIGCHQKRTAGSQKAGPAACGECHRADRESAHKEYVPVLPEYYNAAKDAYHKDCLACHREPAKPLKEAGALDWKSFYLREQKLAETAWPKVAFDYLVHDKHDKALEKKCDPCHSISPARRQKLAAEGKQPANRDWLQDIDKANSLTEQKSAHARCLNCHLARKAAKKNGGPSDCNACHSGVERTAKAMANIPRPACEQKDRYLIEIKADARAKGVPFNHKSHEANSRSCQECHHETLRPCGDCHTGKGSKEGGGVTFAEAYHKASSSWSCIGCHEIQKKKPACDGCHARMENGLAQSACTACHSGDLKSLDTAAKLPAPKDLLANDVKDEMAIGVMEKSYRPSKFPHLAIARKLTDLSNQSTLAGYFHRNEATICAGCHHRAPVQAKAMVPQCITCHGNRQQPEGATPTLLGAYHQQCLGCHKQMVQTEKKLPQNCIGCHEEKRKG